MLRSLNCNALHQITCILPVLSPESPRLSAFFICAKSPGPTVWTRTHKTIPTCLHDQEIRPHPSLRAPQRSRRLIVGRGRPGTMRVRVTGISRDISDFGPKPLNGALSDSAMLPTSDGCSHLIDKHMSQFPSSCRYVRTCCSKQNLRSTRTNLCRTCNSFSPDQCATVGTFPFDTWRTFRN